MNEVRIVTVADLHLRARTPVTRRGNYLHDALRKWRWCDSYAQKVGADILIVSGDWFNSLDSVAISLISWLLRVLTETKTPVVFVLGNHDVRADGDMGHMYRRAIGVIAASGKARLLDEKGFRLKHLVIFGSTKPMTIDQGPSNFLQPEAVCPGVMVTHGSLVSIDQNYRADHVCTSSVAELNPRQILHINGHLHDFQFVERLGKTVYVSTGSLMRDAGATPNHKVYLGDITIRDDTVTEAKLVEVAAAKPFEEAFDLSKTAAIKAEQTSIKNFVERLGATDSMVFTDDSLLEGVDAMEMGPDVRKRVRKYLEEAQSQV